MVRVDDIETARTAEGGCAVVGARRCASVRGLGVGEAG